MNNESAFPIPATEQHFYNQDPLAPQIGLTKREYFAAMAMQGAIAGKTVNGCTWDEIASLSVLQADYLIAELSKPIQ